MRLFNFLRILFPCQMALFQLLQTHSHLCLILLLILFSGSSEPIAVTFTLSKLPSTFTHLFQMNPTFPGTHFLNSFIKTMICDKVFGNLQYFKCPLPSFTTLILSLDLSYMLKYIPCSKND